MKSEYRFRQMSENIDQAFYMMEADYSEVLYANSATERIYGISVEQLYEDPMAWTRYIVDEDLRKIKDDLDEQRSETFDEPQEQTFRVDHPDRGRRHVQARIYPIQQDGSHNQLVGVSTDVTERKETEQNLRETEQRFRQIAENIEEVFWMSDPEKNEIEYISPAYEQIWGRSVEDLYEAPDQWIESIVPEDRDRIREASKDQAEPGAYDVEYRIETPDGEQRWIRDRAFPVENEKGEVTRVTGLAEDITEVKEIQQSLENSLREKETLLQEVHHRVKNNMQIIISLLRIQARQIDDRIHKLVTQSRQRIRSMALIHEKLYQAEDLARIDYGNYVRELVQGLVNTRRAREISVKLEFDLDEDVRMELDRAIPCGLVISELISNSLEHAFVAREEGLIRVVFEQNDVDYQVEIIDDGVGINEEQKKTSMGQQLVTTLVEDQLNGSVMIGQTPNGGTRCVLNFPREQQGEDRPTG